MDLPEQVPDASAIDAGCIRDLAWHVDEVGAHPEDAKGHKQGDQRQRDREPRVVEPHRPLQEVNGKNNPRERERQPEHEQKEEYVRATDAEEADGKPGHRRNGKGHRHHEEDN